MTPTKGAHEMRTRNALDFYTPDKAIEYVGWLLAALAENNVNKGIKLLDALPSDGARVAAKAHATYLLALYDVSLLK